MLINGCRLLCVVVVLTFLMSMLGCGGASAATSAAPTLQPVTISITPTSANVVTMTTQTFTATVNNAGSQSVSWQVNGISGGNSIYGTIDSNGNYTAPQYIPFPSTIAITAYSTVDNTKSASANVTITGAEAPIMVLMNQPTASLTTGNAVTFTATVSNATNTVNDLSVTWEVNGVTGGNSTVGVITPLAPVPPLPPPGGPGSDSATYVAPLYAPSPNIVTVTAISNQDPTQSGSITVTINQGMIQPITVSVVPAQIAVQIGKSVQFSATVTGAPTNSVTWEVNNIPGGNTTVGTIDTTGLYLAPKAVPNPAIVTVSAVSTLDPTKSGTAAVTITATPPVVSVTLTAASNQLETGQTTQLTATVTNGSNSDITWEVNGLLDGGDGTYGTIVGDNGTGNDIVSYQAPQLVPSNPVVQVTAISKADQSKSASVNITITVPTNISVVVLPDLPNQSIVVNQTQQFKANVLGSTDQTVTWEVNGEPGGDLTIGTISTGGLYTAPAIPPLPNPTVVIGAVPQADPTKIGTASITVVPVPVVTVTIDPTQATVLTTYGQLFTATVTGANIDSSVTWYVNNIPGGDSTVGTIVPNLGSDTAQYTAPATVPTPDTVTVTATSNQDPTKSASATVTIQLYVAITVNVNPPSASLMTGQSLSFDATVNGTMDQNVTWSLSGAGCTGDACGTLTSTTTNPTTYTAPQTIPNPATVTLTATSEQGGTPGSSTITITAIPLGVTISPNPPAPIPAGSGQTIVFTATITGAPANTNLSWGLECNSESDSNGDFCFDTDFDQDGPGCTQLPGGFQLCGAVPNVGPGNEALTYTPPGKLYTDTFQANACTSSPGNNGIVPLLVKLTYNGNEVDQTVCITVTPQAP
jgi:hypothetical protein